MNVRRATAVIGVALLYAAVGLVAGCGRPQLGFGVALTLRFDAAVGDAVVAEVASIAIHADGDETFDQTLVLGRAAARTERVVYRPLPASRSIHFRIEALGAGGATLATGDSADVGLVSGETSTATVTLTPLGGGDGGVPDSGAPDGGGPIDAAVAPPVSTIELAAAPLSYVDCATDIAIGDLNGDPHPDVVISCRDSYNIYVFIAGADGTLPDAPSKTMFLNGVGAIAVIDFNGDKRGDIVAAEAVTSPQLHLLQNDFLGGFPEVGVRPFGSYATVKLLVADFDKDFYPDLLVATLTLGGNAVLYGTGAASTAFTVQTGVVTDQAASTNARIVDLDKDGYPDFVLVQQNSDQIETFRNLQATSPRAFGSGNPVAIPSKPSDVVFADVNNDGKPEALVSYAAAGQASLLLLANTGGVLSTTTTSLNAGTGSTLIDHLLLVDLDGDGVPELISSHAGATGLSGLRVAKGSAALSFAATARFYSAGSAPSQLFAADVDGDQVTDLIVEDRGRASVASTSGAALVRGLGAGRLQAAELAAAPTAFGGAQGLVTADFDNDGKTDLLLSDYVNVSVLFGDGALRYPSSSAVPYYSASALAVGDLDGDGHTDLVVASDLNGTYKVALGKPDGRLGTATGELALGSRLGDIRLADFDSDGTLDLLSADYMGDAVRVSRGNGNGTFATAPVTTSVHSAVRLQVGDLDGDGDPDVVALGYDMVVSVLLDDGQGQLATPQAIGVEGGASEILLVDYTGDGKLDLVVVGNGLQLIPGNGDGTFAIGAATVVPLLRPYRRLIAVDLNRDHVPELVATTATTVEVLQRSAMGYATVASIPLGPADLLELAAGDFDGDGLPELVIDTGANTAGAAILHNVSHD